MNTIYDRTEKLLGAEKINKLKNSKVIVFGLGGVGGQAVEALARTGIGRLGIADFDVVDVTNANRQIIALQSTIGKYKADAFKERLLDINGVLKVDVYKEKVASESIDSFPLGDYDYVVDAIDDVPAKIMLIKKAKSLGVPVISAMGAGNKSNPSKFKVSDVSKTHTCPLAKRIRKELGISGIKDVKVVFSDEVPERFTENVGPPASIAFVPAAAGLMIAAEVVHDLLL